ncbi:type II toxin-antitoxin system Phd/YefM family antitoxin [Streptomyces sp. AD55]|uniref:type II toxin-antitoxin system Phd/YefM family antitoxin n=1 Tax=Streptomyces sp. AD55 TaxID=3242895 RepID=UPI00352749D9
MPANTSHEIGVRNLRMQLADVLNAASARGRTTYITSHGRRIAAIVPVAVAEGAEGSVEEDAGDEPA